jgi:general L-amino acid transport system permease protein
MATTLDAPQVPRPTSRPRTGWDAYPVTRWLRANLFSSITSTIITLLLLALLAKAIIGFLQWGILDAVWIVPGNDSAACRAARGIGACWAVIPEKYRFILFGTYPYDQQWRPALATLVFIALFYVSCLRPSASPSASRSAFSSRSAAVQSFRRSARSACSMSS